MPGVEILMACDRNCYPGQWDSTYILYIVIIIMYNVLSSKGISKGITWSSSQTFQYISVVQYNVSIAYIIIAHEYTNLIIHKIIILPGMGTYRLFRLIYNYFYVGRFGYLWLNNSFAT